MTEEQLHKYACPPPPPWVRDYITTGSIRKLNDNISELKSLTRIMTSLLLFLKCPRKLYKDRAVLRPSTGMRVGGGGGVQINFQ